MKSLKELWRVAANELAAWCCTSTTLDYKKLESRVEHEGLSFLTITLPSFAKDFERSLEAKKVDSSVFVGFQRRQGPLPIFLGGFLSQVFDSSNGLLLDSPSIDAIFAIRQLTLMFKKIKLPSTPARERAAMRGYIECENEVKRAAELGSTELYKRFSRIAALLYSDVFSELENELYEGTLTPRHGPGATADGLRGNAKYHQLEWPQRMEAVFSYWENAAPGGHYASLDHFAEVDFVEPGSERPVKVISVPKTLQTPRIIAIEPTSMQYMQQAVSKKMSELLESSIIAGNTRSNVVFGQIGFKDQVPNRLLAHEGSLTGSLATLDLSEASDRVSMRHVESLVSFWPLLQEALEVTRSSKASVPGWGIVPLSKYASMGSALTFPVEAMTFLVAVYMGLEERLGRHITRKDVQSMRGKVRIYGDDIIIPVDLVRPVIGNLELLGFKINAGKSFWNGNFRESCGGDYFSGSDVTPVRVTRVFPSSRADVSEIQSLVALRNLFYSRGLWQTAKYLDSVVRKVLPYFPIVGPTSDLLGRHSVCFTYNDSVVNKRGTKMCPKLHRPLVKGYVARSRIPDSKASGFGALLKFFLKQGDDPFADPKHLERQGRPDSVDINIRWRPPF
jgi:hypothetical protein